jgi:drug/metabolite transporter (DMT)-like permease
MEENKKSLINIHLAVFLFGFSALFARLINQPSIVITFGRVFLSSAFLFFLTRYKKLKLKLVSKKDYFLMIISGIILAAHWFCFIQSIQLSTVAIGTITFSTFPLFTSFLEPVIFKEKIKIRYVVCSIIMLGGIILLARITNHQESFQQLCGIIIGLVSSLTYAVLSLFNRSFSLKYKSEIIVFYEQFSAAIILLPAIIIIKPVIIAKDLILLAFLGIVFTAIAHGLFVKGLRHVKVSSAGIISGLEVIYSITLASFLLKEFPAINEIAGGFIVMVAAAYITISKEKN